MTAPPVPILECRNIRVSAGAKTILDDVSLSLWPGESLMVIGPNGSGKTTLLYALLGLVPIASGQVLLAGKPIDNHSRLNIARYLSYMPQLPERPAGFSAFEYVLTARYARRRHWGGYSREDQEAAEAAIALTGMESFTHRPLASLSGGELQKIMLAAAVAQETPVLLLDEPAAFLDYRHQVEIMTLVECLRLERNLSVVMVTHDLNIPFLNNAHLLALKEGRTLFQGTVSDLPEKQNLLESLYDTAFDLIPAGSGKWFIRPAFPDIRERMR
ncbi:MAG TPA: ABC transporter ATP-binding protein [Candidatus Hydrogenedentes bacterium]|nr:ABC transporter ATP-binding protein [Candidatus Hydrogenedentota bacterium]